MSLESAGGPSSGLVLAESGVESVTQSNPPTPAPAIAVATADLKRPPGSGKAFWRSLEEWADTPEFREYVAKTAPEAAEQLVRSEAAGVDRRRFLQLMAASLSLAGLAGCRRPSIKILPYAKKPETVTPGMPTFYATSMPLKGSAIGLLAESHDGRPTKIEGNPEDPFNKGKADLYAQASVLSLYDPDRSRYPVRRAEGRLSQTTATWAQFDEFAAKVAERARSKGGQGLAILSGTVNSPVFDLIRDHLSQTLPKAVWYRHEPIDNANIVAGWSKALAAPALPRFHYDRAKVVVALDCDFLGVEAEGPRDLNAFAQARRGVSLGGTMNRLYVVENHFTLTGGMADHRLRLPASQVPDYLAVLARRLLERLSDGEADAGVRAFLANFTPTPEFDADWAEKVADDLLDEAHKGRSIVVAGRRQPAAVHALVALLNAKLGNLAPETGPVSVVAPPMDAPDLTDLVAAIDRNEIETLVILDSNPVYSAPADLEFAKKIGQIATVIHIGEELDETGKKALWHLPMAHYLESWGVSRTPEGVLLPIQPLIEPLFNARVGTELVAKLVGLEPSHAHELARAGFAKALGLSVDSKEFESAWREFLHLGVKTGIAPPKPAPAATVDPSNVADALKGWSRGPELSRLNLELAFQRDASMDDGRWANNGWLQEVSDPVTKVCWDNCAYVSPATARELGIRTPTSTRQEAELVTLSVGDRSLTVPMIAVPGHADSSITLTLGYGRTEVGRVGQDTGFNAFLLRTTEALDIIAGGVRVERLGRSYPLALTQDHHPIEDPGIAKRIGTLVQIEDYRTAQAKEKAHHDTAHGQEDGHDQIKGGHGADQATSGDHGHGQAGIGTLNFDAGLPFRYGNSPEHPKFFDDIQTQNPDLWSGEQQWGMAIDLNSCVGCNACVVACQAENNIPIVGKDEVIRGREMHWIRNDRYFTGTDADDPGMVFQPLPCQHCENAPCEAVCPVNATVHSDEGLNLQAYNRCIGTRYCANNCPYKVRRFNWFNYNERQLGYTNLRWPKPYGPLTPRAMEETLKMQKNPDVTVRIRGVMEKCSFCIQRIERAKIGVRGAAGQTPGADLRVPDGGIVTACQQTCPTEAIVFGDIKDPNSKVSKLKSLSRDYLLVGDINTRPRVSYQTKLTNPNPNWSNAGRPGGSSPSRSGEGGPVDAAPAGSVTGLESGATVTTADAAEVIQR